MDIFGPSPMGPRPTHPDFAIMVDIILQHDGYTEDSSFSMDEHLARFCDPETASYVALQRGFRMAKEMGVNPLERPDLAVRMASIWIDGFMLGHELTTRKAEGERIVYTCSACGVDDDAHAFAACDGGEWKKKEA
jgi:hypothetical protein